MEIINSKEMQIEDIQNPEILNPDSILFAWLKLVLDEEPSHLIDFSQSLEENPGRITRAYRELLSGYLSNPEVIMKTTLDLPEKDFDGLVSCLDIPFLSFCAHHFLPYFGSVDVVYEPGDRIVGLGKIPRLVDCRTRRFEIQEMATKKISEDMMNFAHAKGAYTSITGLHTCICYRGPNKHVSKNVTSYACGTLADKSRRDEIGIILKRK